MQQMFVSLKSPIGVFQLLIDGRLDVQRVIEAIAEGASPLVAGQVRSYGRMLLDLPSPDTGDGSVVNPASNDPGDTPVNADPAWGQGEQTVNDPNVP